MSLPSAAVESSLSRVRNGNPKAQYTDTGLITNGNESTGPASLNDATSIASAGINYTSRGAKEL